MVTAETIAQRVKALLPDAEVRAVDMTGGGDHWQLAVQSSHFNGKSLVQQHQLIYQALGELMAGPIHALKLETKAKG
jgi:stress-induced morphogen